MTFWYSVSDALLCLRFEFIWRLVRQPRQVVGGKRSESARRRFRHGKQIRQERRAARAIVETWNCDEA